MPSLRHPPALHGRSASPDVGRKPGVSLDDPQVDTPIRIAPEPDAPPTADGEQAGGADGQIRALTRALARERWKQRRLDAR